MFEFANIEKLWYLIIVPVLILLFILARSYRQRVLKQLGDKYLIAGLMPLASNRRAVLKFFLLLSALVFIIFALARPRFGSRLEEVKKEGSEIIIALDVSKSMLAEDIRPNRLSGSKLAISRLLQNLRNDRIGIIVFAGDAYIQVPLTSDYRSAQMLLNNITTDIVSVPGTAIGRAIELATRSFSPSTTSGKTVIIISDGEDHEDDPIEAAKVSAGTGVTIHTIGLGRPEGAPIPLPGATGYLTDNEGNTVITRLDERTLVEVATAGGGIYVRGTGAANYLDVIMEEIDKMEREEFGELVFTQYEERYHYMAIIAILLLLVDFFIRERKNRWLNSLKIFKPV